MRRSDVLLAFLASPSAGHEPDQIRIMKGLFLLSREGPGELLNLYAFEPYDYGPFDKGVYADIDRLMTNGLISVEPSVGSSRKIYRLTDPGRERAGDVRGSMDPDALAAIDETKRVVTEKTFNELLRYVYGRHPDMATRSKFTG